MRVLNPRMLMLVACALPSISAAGPAQAQDRGIGVAARGAIEILEPVEWRGVETRGIAVRSRESLRVVGRVSDPGGVNGVLINGDRAALQVDGGGAVRFTGFVRVDERTTEVEIAAFTNDGRTLLRTFALDPQPTEKLFEDPSAAFTPENGFAGKRWAVVVGVSEYEDRRIPSLRFADRDARAFYDFITSPQAGIGGYPEENVVLLLNGDATYRNLRTALFSFLKEATEEDQVVIYFAGHGAPDPERLQNLYLLTHDTRVDNVSGTAFPMADMAAATRNILARDVIVITDACHSAGVGGQVGLRDVGANQINQAFLDQLNASTGGLTIFTASQATQASHEGEQWGGGHGVFTFHLLEALRGAADDDQDRIVTLVEMMEYTRERVRRETRNAQIPTISQTAFDASLPLSIVLDPEAYARSEPVASSTVALPSMFAVEEPPPLQLYDPTSALIRGLTVPGMGMFYIDRPGLGAAYAAGTVVAAGAALYLAVDAVDRWRDENCPGGMCEDWSRSSVPWWVWQEGVFWTVAPVVAGGTVWVIGALHAKGAAEHWNAEQQRLRRSSRAPGDPSFTGPRLAVAPGGQLGLEIARIRF